MRKLKLYEQRYDESGWELGWLADKSFEGSLVKSFSLLAENEIYQERPTVLSATLQITDECNLACEHCAQTQCPECTRYGTNSRMDYEQAVRLIDSLHAYGLKKIILCGGEPALYDSIGDLILYIKKRGISVMVHTNGMIPLQADLEVVEVIVHIDSMEQFKVVEENYHDMNYVVVFVYDPMEKIQPKNPTWKVLSRRHNFHQLENPKNIVQFTPDVSVKQSVCSRIHIMNNFDVVVGLGSLEYIGNVMIETIEAIMNRWDQKQKNQWKEGRMDCNACEFRYSCSQRQALFYHKILSCDILLM